MEENIEISEIIEKSHNLIIRLIVLNEEVEGML